VVAARQDGRRAVGDAHAHLGLGIAERGARHATHTLARYFDALCSGRLIVAALALAAVRFQAPDGVFAYGDAGQRVCTAAVRALGGAGTADRGRFGRCRSASARPNRRSSAASDAYSRSASLGPLGVMNCIDPRAAATQDDDCGDPPRPRSHVSRSTGIAQTRQVSNKGVYRPPIRAENR
jgi:hypothetical protein